LAKHKAFLLRVNPEVLDAVQRWADDELRSLNGQIEYLLRRALIDARRTKPRESPHTSKTERHVEDFID